MAPRSRPPKTARGIPPRKLDARRYEQEINRLIVAPMFAQVDTAIRAANRDYIDLRNKIRAIPLDPSVTALAGQAAKDQMARLKAYHTKRYHQTMRRYLGLSINFMSDGVLEPILSQAIAENVDLIVTIPRRFLDAVTADLTRLAREAPFDQKALADTLRKNYQSTGYNLRRLARDQTSKTIGKLTKARHEQAGITEYVWRSSRDGRVRETHRQNDGRVFNWNAPPSATGHPGEDIQCRCVADPVVAGIQVARQPQEQPPTLPQPAPPPPAVAPPAPQQPPTAPPVTPALFVAREAARSAAEKKWHGRSWWAKNSNAAEAASIAPALTGGVRKLPGKYAFYRRGPRMINMTKENLNSRSSRGVWMHEFGHHIDHMASGGLGAMKSGDRQSFVKAMKATAKRTDNIVAADRDLAFSRGVQLTAKTAAQRRKLFKDLEQRTGISRREIRQFLKQHGYGRTKAAKLGVLKEVQETLEYLLHDAIARKDLQMFRDVVFMERHVFDRALARFQAGNLYEIGHHVSMRRQLYEDAGVLPAFDDIIDATTYGRVEVAYKHSENYYKTRSGGRQSEIFANSVQIKGTDELADKVYRKLMPELSNEADEILNDYIAAQKALAKTMEAP